MPVHAENEATLLAEAREGKPEAFTELVNRYERNIYRLALNLTGNRADAEDVLQEAFLKAYSHLDQFQGNSRFYTWLVRIAVNEGLMKLRKRRSDKSTSLDEMGETEDDAVPRQLVAWEDTPEQRYAKTELQSILSEAVESLEPTFRTVFVLRDIEDLSTQETAELLSLSIPAVKSRLLRARLKLRQRLNKYFTRG